jgi:hypothetical protein
MFLVSLLLGCPKPAVSPAVSPDAPSAGSEVPTPAVGPEAGSTSGSLASTEEAIAPRPFTPEQLRDGMPVGETFRYRKEVQGEAAIEERWVVVAADEVGCTLETRSTDPATGEPVEGQGTSTWAELVDHAAFPAAATTRVEGTVTVPAGTFEAITYTVQEPDGTVSVYDFAKAHPGPPIRLVSTREGVVTRSMILLERGSGG